MTSDVRSAIIVLVCVVIFLIALAINNHIKNKRSMFVIENSRLIREIDNINKIFNFYVIQNTKYSHKCKSKQEYDRKNLMKLQ